MCSCVWGGGGRGGAWSPCRWEKLFCFPNQFRKIIKVQLDVRRAEYLIYKMWWAWRWVWTHDILVILILYIYACITSYILDIVFISTHTGYQTFYLTCYQAKASQIGDKFLILFLPKLLDCWSEPSFLVCFGFPKQSVLVCSDLQSYYEGHLTSM